MATWPWAAADALGDAFGVVRSDVVEARRLRHPDKCGRCVSIESGVEVLPLGGRGTGGVASVRGEYLLF